MRNSNFKKIALLILVLPLISAVIIFGLNAANISLSHFIIGDENKVEIDSTLGEYLYAIDSIQPENEQSLKFITCKSNDRPYSLLIDNLKFVHEIYINDELVSQNADKETANYVSDYAYKVFEISKSGDINIQINGSGVAGLKLYLADSQVMENSIKIRIICNALLLFMFFLQTLISVIWYINKRTYPFFLVFAMIGVVTIIKTISTGEFPMLAGALGFTVRNYSFWCPFTACIELLLPGVVMIHLLGIRMTAAQKAVAFICAVIITLLNVWLPVPSPFSLITIIAAYLLCSAVCIYGYIKDKPYSKIIYLNNTVFSSIVIYGFLVTRHVYKSGDLDFYFYAAYLGTVIYLSVFFAVLIKNLSSKMKELEKKKKEFERITLLRGISHDMKLPLSAIKINIQMLEKYKLGAEELKECAQLSSEAVLDLEKMTENISSFINMDEFANGEYTASLHECFDKISRHYAALSLDSEYVFSALWEGEDITMPIKSFQIERMLFNLLDNAFKYNSNCGKVSLSCQTVNKKAIITVEDSGIGMEKDQIDNIYTPFYRADDSRTVSGLGLGLCVVKGVVDGLKGEIKVESGKGTGTKIIVVLPAN